MVGLLPWLLVVLGPRSLILGPAFHSFCHQLPERTLSLRGVPMLVCSRCAGIYAGIALGALGPWPTSFAPKGRMVLLLP